MSLQYILEQQKVFQNELGYDFDKMNMKERATYIREQIYWATEEMHETGREIPFIKTWSKKYDKNDYDIKKQYLLARKEYIDLIHFIANIGVALNMDEKMILEMYKEKHKINYDRQKNGY